MGQRLALIIGNSAYLDQALSRLLSPDADVSALGEVLLDPELGGFDEVNVLVNMSSHIIRRSIASFFSKRSREDLLVLYFSGHGVLDDQGHLYLAVKDTDSKLLRGTAISANYITDEMNNSRSQRQVLILDCCHSGAFARGTKGQPGASVGTASAFEGTGYGRVVLTASDATQYAWEGEQVIGEAENSLFTHYMLQGIKRGEADLNRDGQITIDELYDYVYERVVGQTQKQTPGKWSYKERGEIIVSRAPGAEQEEKAAVSLPEFDREVEGKLEKLYHEGLSAYWLEDWEKAVGCFQALVEARPDYPDAANKLELSRRKQQVRSLYEKALASESAGDWPSAIASLKELIAIEPEYLDAPARLEHAKRSRMLADLYAEARQLSQAEKWQAVVNVFAQITGLQPGYPDPEGLLAAAQINVAEIERQANLERKYNMALSEMDVGNWLQAEGLLAEVQEMEPGYQAADRLLERARLEISHQQNARQLEEQVATLYQQALGLARSKHWRKVLEKMEEIQALDPDFEDTDGVIRKARAEIEREEQEAQLQKELAEIYTAAVRSMEAGQYQQALEQWAEVQALDPGYPDRQRVVKIARKKLKELSKIESPRSRISPRQIALVAIGGVILLAVVIFLGMRGLFGSAPVFDDFDNSRFDGAYDPAIWGYEYRSDPELCSVAQKSNRLVFSAEGMHNSIELYLNQAYDKPLKAGTAIEAWLRVDGTTNFAHVGFGIGSEAYRGHGAVCQIQTRSEDNIHCWVDISGTVQSVPLQPINQGEWHKVRIEISDLEPFTVTFYADDELIGQVIDNNVQKVGQERFSVVLAFITYAEKLNFGYVDKVQYIPGK